MTQDKDKSEYERQHELMKKWNEKRAKAEEEGIKKFWEMYSSPVLHPSKVKKNNQLNK